MLTRCCICGLPLAVPDGAEDAALCAGCLLANFSGQTVPEPELWGRLDALARRGARRGEHKGA